MSPGSFRARRTDSVLPGHAYLPGRDHLPRPGILTLQVLEALGRVHHPGPVLVAPAAVRWFVTPKESSRVEAGESVQVRAMETGFA